MFGPVEGRRHDAAMLAESGLLEQIEHFVAPNGVPFCLYGDPAYPLRQCLIGPFKGAHLTPQEINFNKDMSSVREAVEWDFGKIINLFGFLDFKKNQKMLLQSVAKYYLVGALFANCHTCLHGGQISDYFRVASPTLEEYLHVPPQNEDHLCKE